MPKVILSLDGAVLKEVDLTKERTTLGRRPYNDIVIENLAVSGEHAVFVLVGGQVVLEDLNSTNGTYINGKVVKKQALLHNDVVEIGKFRLKFENPQPAADFEKTMVLRPHAAAAPPAAAPMAPSIPEAHPQDVRGSIKVISGAAAGRELPLTKVVTTFGKPGVAVAAITRRTHQFLVHHVEGDDRPFLNGVAIGSEPVVLKHGDQIVLAGTHMQFFQS
ncbi:FHA domain-containing protein [Candidatus Symbiobacter mobilis]|uniref:Forkhead-associated protein n=1 Tax=Candidatus Symbiobacter mobilis CR TaxID=946483 RepID=U5N9H9_9BURK|nr:FHA domain-containing protein [Candidatus Symbiobacter mobilis]AGX88062.1 forkhead-associated protein [Candidatus Symbiobacter mobilis CR]